MNSQEGLWLRIWDGLQVSFTGGRFHVPEPEYSIKGHASSTSAHVAAHKANMSQKKLTFLLRHIGLNADGAEVPL